jgi:hypothetical protein
MKIAVEFEDMKLFIVFEFVGCVLRYFDDTAKHLRRSVANRQFQIIHHLAYFSFSGGEWSGVRVWPGIWPAPARLHELTLI